MRTIVKNGILVLPPGCCRADLLIENEKISCIGENLSATDAETIDAKGCYVFPGAIDAHTHMDLQSGPVRAVDDFYSGTVAAAFGGTTTIIDHIGFGPKGCRLHHQIAEYHRLADGQAAIDYSFHGVVQDVSDELLEEAAALAGEGTTSFKIYTTYDYKLDDAQIYRFLKKAGSCGIVTAFHAENDSVIRYLRGRYVSLGKTAPLYHAESRPDDCEAEAVSRILHLASAAGGAPVYFVHVSCAKSLVEIQKARAMGQKNIFAETCPQYLVLTREEYKRGNGEGLKYIMSPPLRRREDCGALWKALALGQIQVVATDHCPFNFAKEKQLGKDDFTKCPNGVPGVEERVRLIYSEGVAEHRITVGQMAEVLCANPAKIFGLYPRKGALLPGSDADLFLLDPGAEETLTASKLHSAVDYTAYEGKRVRGAIPLVMQRGHVLVKGPAFLGTRGGGQFLKRKKFKGW